MLTHHAASAQVNSYLQTHPSQADLSCPACQCTLGVVMTVVQMPTMQARVMAPVRTQRVRRCAAHWQLQINVRLRAVLQIQLITGTLRRLTRRQCGKRSCSVPAFRFDLTGALE